MVIYLAFLPEVWFTHSCAVLAHFLGLALANSVLRWLWGSLADITMNNEHFMGHHSMNWDRPPSSDPEGQHTKVRLRNNHGGNPDKNTTRKGLIGVFSRLGYETIGVYHWEFSSNLFGDPAISSPQLVESSTVARWKKVSHSKESARESDD